VAYKRSVYLKAKEALDNRRAEAQRLQQQRHAEAAQACPAILDAEREMAACGAELIKIACAGGNTQEQLAALSQRNLDAQQRRAELLKGAGFPADYLDNVYTCPVCKDTGTHGSYYCKCYLDLIRQTAKDCVKGAAQLKKCTFETFSLRYYSDTPDPALGGRSHRKIMENVCAYLKHYADNFTPASKSLLMIGKTGLGKTHLSLAVANRVLDRGFNVYYDSAQGIMDRLEKDHFGRGARDEELQEDLYQSDLLVIDDLGTEMVTSFTLAALYQLVNERINDGLPTICSTNLTPAELEAVYSQRLTSRLLGTCDVLQFYGRDVRQQIAGKD
jgi:DNA replication protein DnaC